MNFTADKQTLDDLNLINKYKSDSIFNLFNKVYTRGGEKMLEQMFQHPLTDAEKIKQRSQVFNYFQYKALAFPFRAEDVSLVENYLSNGTPGNIIAAGVANLRKQVLASLIRDDQYAAMLGGFKAAIAVLKACGAFMLQLNRDIHNPYSDLKAAISILNDERLSWLDKENFENITLLTLTKYDHLLRHTLQKELSELVQIIYRLDVYIAVGNTAKESGFCYATPMPKESNVFRAINMRHPALKNAVGNSMEFHAASNVVFLTGANMAGKSTLMKTFGISVYLAHMGFPVAAEQMEFSVKDGIYSSINVADNLNMGYSHFYAEVLRVKKVAEEVSSGKDMIVIFDELFKGTNVKDAYDATLAVTSAFALYRNCFFVISTHIIEVGDALRENCNSVIYSYLPTIMDGPKPTYPYKLEQGITTDRQGMIIIENEGILEMLK